MAKDQEPRDHPESASPAADEPAGELAEERLDEVGGGHDPAAPAPGGTYGSVSG